MQYEQVAARGEEHGAAEVVGSLGASSGAAAANRCLQRSGVRVARSTRTLRVWLKLVVRVLSSGLCKMPPQCSKATMGTRAKSP